MAEESYIKKWLRNVRWDRWLQAKVINSLGSDWQRFERLLVKYTKVELPDNEREELQVLLKKLKAKNLDDPNIQRLKI